MKKSSFLFLICVGLCTLNQVANARPTVSIAKSGWHINAPQGYEDAYLFAKANDTYQALPHYPGKELELGALKENPNQPLKLQGIVLKFHDKELGTTCKNTTIGNHQKLVVGGKVTITPDKKPNFKEFQCTVETID